MHGETVKNMDITFCDLKINVMCENGNYSTKDLLFHAVC